MTLMQTRFVTAFIAGVLVCGPVIAGEEAAAASGDQPEAKSSEALQIECKPRKRTSERWVPVNSARAAQEYQSYQEGQYLPNTNRLPAPQIPSVHSDSSQGGKPQSVPGQVCGLKAVEESSDKKPEGRSTTRKKGPRG